MERADVVVCCDLLGYWIPFTEMIDSSASPGTSVRRPVTYSRYFEYNDGNGSKEHPYSVDAQFSMEYFAVAIRFLNNQVMNIFGEPIVTGAQTLLSKVQDTKTRMKRFNRIMPGYHYIKYFKDLADLTAFVNGLKNDPWVYHCELQYSIRRSLEIGWRRRTKKAVFIQWCLKQIFRFMGRTQHADVGRIICYYFFDYRCVDYRH